MSNWWNIIESLNTKYTHTPTVNWICTKTRSNIHMCTNMHATEVVSLFKFHQTLKQEITPILQKLENGSFPTDSWGSNKLLPKTLQRKKIKTTLSDKHSCKHPWWNISNLNPRQIQAKGPCMMKSRVYIWDAKLI